MENLFIVIPAYNEEANIEAVAREWHKIAVFVGAKSRMVIVDDGSKDGTHAKLQKLQKELPQLIGLTKPNGGHGSAVLYGYRYALDNGADYIFQTDSDGQTTSSEFNQFWENRAQYDCLIGYRKNRQDGFIRIVVTKVLKIVLYLCFHVWIEDANTPFRLMNNTSLKHCLTPIPENYNLANAVLAVIYKKWGYKMKYFAISFRPRQGGNNSINLKKILHIGKNAIGDFHAINNQL